MAAACARTAPERMRRIGVLVNFAQTDREGQAGVAAFVATPKECVHGFADHDDAAAPRL
jgi:hypothetical protein